MRGLGPDLQCSLRDPSSELGIGSELSLVEPLIRRLVVWEVLAVFSGAVREHPVGQVAPQRCLRDDQPPGAGVAIAQPGSLGIPNLCPHHGVFGEPIVEDVECVSFSERLARSGSQAFDTVVATVIKRDLNAEFEFRQPDRVIEAAQQGRGVTAGVERRRRKYSLGREATVDRRKGSPRVPVGTPDLPVHSHRI